MNTFPSKIVSVRMQHFLAVLMEQNCGPSFLEECIEEAIEREKGGHIYSEGRDRLARELAAKL